MNRDRRCWGRTGFRTGIDLSQFTPVPLEAWDNRVKGANTNCSSAIERAVERRRKRNGGGGLMAHTWTVNNEWRLWCSFHLQACHKLAFIFILETAYSSLTGEERTSFFMSRGYTVIQICLSLHFPHDGDISRGQHRIHNPNRQRHRHGAVTRIDDGYWSSRQQNGKHGHSIRIGTENKTLNVSAWIMSTVMHTTQWAGRVIWHVQVVEFVGKLLTGWIEISRNCRFDKLAYASLSVGRFSQIESLRQTRNILSLIVLNLFNRLFTVINTKEVLDQMFLDNFSSNPHENYFFVLEMLSFSCLWIAKNKSNHFSKRNPVQHIHYNKSGPDGPS